MYYIWTVGAHSIKFPMPLALLALCKGPQQEQQIVFAYNVRERFSIYSMILMLLETAVGSTTAVYMCLQRVSTWSTNGCSHILACISAATDGLAAMPTQSHTS